MRTIRIDVTAEDIRDGDPRNCFWCSLALALRRACGVQYVRVDHDLDRLYATIYWLTGKTARVELPYPCKPFVAACDNPALQLPPWPAPFSFELTVED